MPTDVEPSRAIRRSRKYRAVTAFRAAELFARGESAWLEKYYAWCRELGANTLRVLGMWGATGYGPQSFPKYYDQLRDFFAAAQAAGFGVHIAAICDQVEDSPVLMSVADGAAHAERVYQLARDAGQVRFVIKKPLTWELTPIGGTSTPGQHAVHAAARDESGGEWCIHGGFSSIDPHDDSDLQNCIAPGRGTRALACALAVADIWKKAQED